MIDLLRSVPSNSFIFQSPADFPDLITLSSPTIDNNNKFSGNILLIFNEVGFHTPSATGPVVMLKGATLKVSV